MKKSAYIILIINLIILNKQVLAQKKDSVRIDYSEEVKPDSNSSFKDKYNYFTRALIEEKNMLKIGACDIIFSDPILNIEFGLVFNLSYEHKLSPAFSVLVESRYDLPTFDFFSFTEGVRYYYRMPGRIKQGKSANNLSDNYFTIEHMNRFDKVAPNEFDNSSTISLLWGYQRRGRKYMYVDLNLGLGYEYASKKAPESRFQPMVKFSFGLGL